MIKSLTFSSAKVISIFALTLLLGLYSGGFFKRYMFKFGVVESFSESEAKNLVGKRVVNMCNGNNANSNLSGSVISYSGSHFGEVRVNIKWDQSESGYIGFPKSCFKKCVKEVE